MSRLPQSKFGLGTGTGQKEKERAWKWATGGSEPHTLTEGMEAELRDFEVSETVTIP